MPRIAAAIGVFAAIAGLTFINIKTYPTVWEMVGSSSWFTRQAESSPSITPAQPPQIAEKKAVEAVPAAEPELKSLSGSKTLLPADAMSQEIPPLQAQTGAAAPYQGLNVGPIIVSQPRRQAAAGENVLPPKKSLADAAAQAAQGDAATELPATAGSTWPAEMSPQMKYAAKPPLLENYQNWNPERPVVPVDNTQEFEKTKDSQDSDGEKVKKQEEEARKDADPDMVLRLPPVDTTDRPILMSISPDGPIPVYPSTGK